MEKSRRSTFARISLGEGAVFEKLPAVGKDNPDLPSSPIRRISQHIDSTITDKNMSTLTELEERCAKKRNKKSRRPTSEEHHGNSNSNPDMGAHVPGHYLATSNFLKSITKIAKSVII